MHCDCTYLSVHLALPFTQSPPSSSLSCCQCVLPVTQYDFIYLRFCVCLIKTQVTLGVVHTTGGRINIPWPIKHLEWFLTHRSIQGSFLENYSAHLDNLTCMEVILMTGERKALCVGWRRDAEGLRPLKLDQFLLNQHLLKSSQEMKLTTLVTLSNDGIQPRAPIKSQNTVELIVLDNFFEMFSKQNLNVLLRPNSSTLSMRIHAIIKPQSCTSLHSVPSTTESIKVQTGFR